MNPELWGPHAWYFLYSIAFSYPDNPTMEDKYSTKAFFECIGNVLPCNTCRINYRKNKESLPMSEIVLSSRKNLVNWVLSIHNKVNAENGKTMATLNDIKSFLESCDTKKNHPNNNQSSKSSKYIFIILLVIFIVVIIGFLGFKGLWNQ